MRENNNFDRAKKIAQLSGFVWVLSLFFTGIILYGGRKLSGFTILLTGWLAPIEIFMGSAGCFAWYANFFFFFALISQLHDKRQPAIKTSLLSVILAIDSIRYNQYLDNEGGSTTPVYGYGVGFILWFSAILLLLSSVIVKSYDLKDIDLKNKKIYKNIVPISICPLLLFLTLVGYFSFNFWLNGNNDEKKFGSSHSVVFKLKKDCEVEIGTPKIKFNVDQPIEILDNCEVMPFDTPKQALEWGIPRIRINNLDYYLVPDRKPLISISSGFGGLVKFPFFFTAYV